ncbi:MAG: hypothetical protein H7X93_13100 [Sphingomonadaceae bacterium]|nr:hypothetical protein [Sphingomonadaceae bacterium]
MAGSALANGLLGLLVVTGLSESEQRCTEHAFGYAHDPDCPDSDLRSEHRVLFSAGISKGGVDGQLARGSDDPSRISPRDVSCPPATRPDYAGAHMEIAMFTSLPMPRNVEACVKFGTEGQVEVRLVDGEQNSILRRVLAGAIESELQFPRPSAGPPSWGTQSGTDGWLRTHIAISTYRLTD